MAYVNLEDDTAGMELLCFSRTLNESGGFIRENSAILATGNIELTQILQHSSLLFGLPRGPFPRRATSPPHFPPPAAPFIRENSAILATGKISVRDDKEPQLMVDSIRPLSDLDQAPGGR